MYLGTTAVLTQHASNVDGNGVGPLLEGAGGYEWLDSALESICALFILMCSYIAGIDDRGNNRGLSDGRRGDIGLLVCVAWAAYWWVC